MYKKKFRYGSKFSMWESLVRTHLALKKINIPEQQIKCLVAFCIYGINETTYNLLINKKIVPNLNMIRNFKTFLKDKGLIVKVKSKQWKVCDSLDFQILDKIIIDVTLELNDTPKQL